MSKKKSRTDAREVAEFRIEESKRWAIARRDEHMSYREMARRTIEAPEDGGLGYYLSEHQLKARVTKYLDDMKLVHEEDKDEHRARELAGLDLVSRLALAAMHRAAKVDTLDVHAMDRFLKAGESRRKLLGLDAPTEAKVDVTMHDGVTAELNAMLAEAGIAPIEVDDSTSRH